MADAWIGCRVFDWDHLHVGCVSALDREGPDRLVRALVIRLRPELRLVSPAEQREVTVPMGRVFGLRADSVILDRTFAQLTGTARPLAAAPSRPGGGAS